jgi:hypothetical protein
MQRQNLVYRHCLDRGSQSLRSEARGVHNEAGLDLYGTRAAGPDRETVFPSFYLK